MTNTWNCPVNGDWSTIDFTKPPWAAGIAVLTHEQVLFVQSKVEIVKAAYKPKIGEPSTPSDEWVQAEYNKLVNYEQAVNGQTFACIKAYDPEKNTLGLDASGIVQPPNVTIGINENGEPYPVFEQQPTEGAGV